MWRGKLSLEKLREARDQWRDEGQTGRDISIIQLYNRESKAQRERHRKIIEIQREARRKDESNKKSGELEARAAEIRRKSKAKAGFNIVKLPPIESPIKPTRRGLRKRAGETTNEPFLPDIDANNNSRVIHAGADHRPSRDPRFQSLISCLLTSEEYFGDLQRFAPPRKEAETNRRTRVGLGFLKSAIQTKRQNTRSII